jgi:hypothetical protein
MTQSSGKVVNALYGQIVGFFCVQAYGTCNYHCALKASLSLDSIIVQLWVLCYSHQLILN